MMATKKPTTAMYATFIASYPNYNPAYSSWKSLMPDTPVRSTALAHAYRYVQKHPKDIVHVYRFGGKGQQGNIGKVRKSNMTGKIVWCEYDKDNIDGIPTYHILDKSGFCRGRLDFA